MTVTAKFFPRRIDRLIDRENYKIGRYTCEKLMDGTIKGRIKVKEVGRKTSHTVHYRYTPGSNSGWQQWGAPNEVLCITTELVERLCYGEEHARR